MVRFGRYLETASWNSSGAVSRRGHLRLGLNVDAGIDLAELEEILTVVASLRMIVCGRRKPEVLLTPVLFRGKITECQARGACRVNGLRQHNDRPVEPHLNLQIALRSAVIRVSSRCVGNKRIRH